MGAQGCICRPAYNLYPQLAVEPEFSVSHNMFRGTRVYAVSLKFSF